MELNRHSDKISVNSYRDVFRLIWYELLNLFPELCACKCAFFSTFVHIWPHPNPPLYSANRISGPNNSHCCIRLEHYNSCLILYSSTRFQQLIWATALSPSLTPIPAWKFPTMRFPFTLRSLRFHLGLKWMAQGGPHLSLSSLLKQVSP